MGEQVKLNEISTNESNEENNENHITSLDLTSAGDIPEDWDSVRLGKVSDDTLYGASEPAEEYDPNKPRYIRITDIDEFGYLKNDTKKRRMST